MINCFVRVLPQSGIVSFAGVSLFKSTIAVKERIQNPSYNTYCAIMQRHSYAAPKARRG